MIDAVFEVNTVEYEGAMQILRRGVRDGFISPQYGTLPVQGRLLAERCQDFTPPRNLGQGRAAVARDLTVIFKPLSPETFTNPRLKKIVQTDNRPAWDAASKNFGDTHQLKNTRAIGFSADWHQRNRMSRGRGRRGKNGNIGVVTLGPEAKQARSYLKETQKHVGWARAGWNAGILGLGGTIRASWMARHGTTGGSLINGTNAPDPFIRVTNSTGWARYGSMGEANRFLQNAIHARSRDMEVYANRMMKLAADKAQKAA